MGETTVGLQQVELASASYVRCQKAPEFFRAFYNRFLARDPAVAPYFATTSFDKQEKLLQHGLSMLLIVARRSNPNLLNRLVDRHGPRGLNIPSNLYPVFLDSLLETVQEFDSACDPAVLQAWRVSLKPGIALLSGEPG
jgi:hemoglobin-like flavoprotein